MGHEYWHDVVIREDSTRGCAVELDLSDGDVARLTVLDGEAMLLGSTLHAGDTAVLPPYVPVKLGEVAFAFGSPVSERWTEATAIAVSGQAASEETADRPPVAGWLDSWRGASTGRLGNALRPSAIFGIVALIVVLLFAGPAIEALQIGGGPAERTQHAITAAGYTGVTVREIATGELQLGGYVASDADRQRIRALVEAKAMRATMSIETGEEMARGVADVARLNGVEGRARTLKAGIVELTAAPLDEAARNRIEAVVKRDVPSLQRLVFRDDPAVGGGDEVRTIADATKRVSSVVDGDPAYILTVDGARYFAGATMPSGHRLVAIQQQTVVLERNGKQVRIRF